MLDLGKIRDEIDATDDEIVRLFQHRMALTAEVAQYKIETGKAVFDAERERQKLEKLTGEGTNAFNTKGIQELFQQIMSISRKRQYQLLTENGGEEMTDYTQVDHLPTHGRRVVFQGVEGAYSFVWVPLSPSRPIRTTSRSPHPSMQIRSTRVLTSTSLTS